MPDTYTSTGRLINLFKEALARPDPIAVAAKYSELLSFAAESNTCPFQVRFDKVDALHRGAAEVSIELVKQVHELEQQGVEQVECDWEIQGEHLPVAIALRPVHVAAPAPVEQ